MSIGIRIILNEGLYLKDPQDSELGRKIIQYSILMFDELGFEKFNFKKLAARIESTEASVYRYFTNKHFLLIYLVSWYWEWVAYLIEINSMNIDDPWKKLRVIIHSIVSASQEFSAVPYVNESVLHELVISEGMKAYHTKDVDKENEKGFFADYKELAKLIADVIKEINPEFKYPIALSSNLIEMSNNHIYFGKHLPRLTDVEANGQILEQVEEMINYFAERLLRQSDRN